MIFAANAGPRLYVRDRTGLVGVCVQLQRLRQEYVLVVCEHMFGRHRRHDRAQSDDPLSFT